MNNKQHIFIEATPLIAKKISGIGHVLYETLLALDDDKYKRDYDFYIFVPFNEKKNLDKLHFKNIKIKTIPIPHNLFSLFSRFRIAIPIDLFLGKGIYVFPNFRNWSLIKSKSITYIHDVCFRIYPEFIEPRNYIFLNKHIKLWCNRSDILISVSNSTKDEIIKYLNMPSNKIKTIHNGVNIDKFYRRDKHEINQIKNKYKLDDYFLFLGNIEPRKNLKDLVIAFKKTDLKDKAGLFIVGGDGWLNESVYREIDKAKCDGFDIRKNDIYIPDEDLPALMSGAIAVIQPSRHEGFGLPVLQALSCGTQVICSNIPGLRETAGINKGVSFFELNNENSLKISIENAYKKRNIKYNTGNMRTWSMVADDLIRLINKELKP